MATTLLYGGREYEIVAEGASQLRQQIDGWLANPESGPRDGWYRLDLKGGGNLSLRTQGVRSSAVIER